MAQPLLAEAIAPRAAASVDTASLKGVPVIVFNLPSSTLGLASGHTIRLDDNAAGWGWFVDPTPWNDSEFTTPGNQGEQNRMDLLTVLAHEVGHLLGHGHEADCVMADALAPGTRQVPGADTCPFVAQGDSLHGFVSAVPKGVGVVQCKQ